MVAGGGLAGLATALFLGRRGYQVTVVERDGHLPAGGPDSVFSAWRRTGVPQARQPHNFLGRSVRVLREEAPDVLDTLIARGALPIPLDLGEGPGDAVVCARRPVFESIIRQAVHAEPTVAIRTGVAVTGILTQPGEVPVVTGVVTSTGETIRGDLVVDATGRRSPILALLTAHGARPAATISQDCGLMYISRYYRLRPGRDYPRLDTPVMAVLDWARAMASPADNGTFALLATITAQDPLRRTLCTEEGFGRFHAAVPAMAPWIHAGQPISKLRTMARLENRYRRLAGTDGPIVGGLVLLGDSALHTNPTAGRARPLHSPRPSTSPPPWTKPTTRSPIPSPSTRGRTPISAPGTSPRPRPTPPSRAACRQPWTASPARHRRRWNGSAWPSSAHPEQRPRSPSPCAA